VIDVSTPLGDVDFEEVKKKALCVTPVPGGVGPMTIAMLLQNVVDAYSAQIS
ncbi:MAG: bifunctional methylenetetrahydrofolate dehydrogenase/methenyltetrahydrofolate cyclohydrolase, partial [Candidatus Thorarchaeota archaeon]|nr:bifunctional methylenetetrahydrofolate dehydrogenase/methenyltetrahydrofolate cyclohydrolase [Candidatus Thorarchaeota archaeon]